MLLDLTQFSIFVFVFFLNPVFNQGITQGDTPRGLDQDAWVMPE
jgi:hypothetical protein